MKQVVLLGATGSIGKQTLDIIDQFPDRFQLVAATAHTSVDAMKEIVDKYQPKAIAIASDLVDAFSKVRCYSSNDIDQLLRSFDQPVVVVNALVGAVGLKPTITAIELGFDVLLANKETLVVGGPVIMPLLNQSKSRLIPIDSEHSALAQCLKGSRIEDVDKLVITASGGSFRDLNLEDLESVTVEDALKHPNWSMGAKITIDSATMMNKVFEIIEAHYLFGLSYDRIEAVLHRESIVHAMVHYIDGNIMMHVGPADMHIPIITALEGEERLPYRSVFDITKIKSLAFETIDPIRYSLFDLGIAVAKKEGLHTVVLNAANEVAVELFLNRKIRFVDIEKIISDCLLAFDNGIKVSLEAILKLDADVRAYVKMKYMDGV